MPTASGVPNSPSLPARPPRPQSFSPVPVPQFRSQQAVKPPPRDSAPELELGEALVEQLLDSEAEPISEGHIEPLSEKSAQVSVEVPKTEITAAEIPALAPVLGAAIELRTRKSPLPGPVLLQPEPSPVDAIVQSLTASDESRPGRTELVRRSLTPPLLEQVDDAAIESVLAPGQRAAFNTSDEPLHAPAEAQPQAASSQPAAVSMLLDPNWLGESEVRAPVELKPSAELHSLISGESKAPVAAAPVVPLAQSAASRGGYVLLAVVAAGLAFTVMRALAPSDDAPEPPRPALPERTQGAQAQERSQRAASGIGVARTAQSAATLVQSDHELPAEITLAPGKGLLEVSTSGKHRIYVDGVFVGPGPLRRVPLSPGTHDIRVSLDGVDVSAPAQIKEGRRTLLQRSGGAPE
jgi:hypothetical protein